MFAYSQPLALLILLIATAFVTSKNIAINNSNVSKLHLETKIKHNGGDVNFKDRASLNSSTRSAPRVNISSPTKIPAQSLFELIPKVIRSNLVAFNISKTELQDVEVMTNTTHFHTKRSTNIYVNHAKDPIENVEEKAEIHLIGWEWEEVGVFITFAIFVFTVGYAKVAFHHTKFLEEYFPESFLMIALGAAIGFAMYALGYRMPLDMDKSDATKSSHYQYYYYQYPSHQAASNAEKKEAEHAFPNFSPRLYFLILIPSIILEQSYALYDAEFAESLYPILLFSIFGKLISTFSIGPILHALSMKDVIPPLISTPTNANNKLSFADSLVFASIISAIDPVPVLGILHEAGVNKQLYFLIFGESLLNDAVTVSLYSSTVAFTGPVKVQESHYGMAALAFLVKSFGGFFIGVIFGLISALATRTTQHHRIVEPLTLLGLAYISYLLAEVVHFSGHICLIGCGLLQAHYAFQNISFTSYNSIIHFVKMLSSTSDAVILMFLGMAMVNYSHVWHTGFILWTLGLCFVCRVIGVYVLAIFHNSTSSRWINFRDQTVLAYCGLRGALCLCLAHMLNGARVPHKSLFVTTTLVIILFTTLVQGGSIRMLLSLLRIKRQKHHTETLNEGTANSVFSLALCGIEAITEVKGNGYVKRMLEKIDEKYLKKIFLSPNADHELHRMYQKLSLECPISSRVPSGAGQRTNYETRVFKASPNGRKIYPTTPPWAQQHKRILLHQPFRVVGKQRQKNMETDNDARIMHAHFADAENEMQHPIMLEIRDMLPSATSGEDFRKIFIARLRSTSAEQRLREIIMERTQHLQAPKAKVAFIEK